MLPLGQKDVHFVTALGPSQLCTFGLRPLHLLSFQKTILSGFLTTLNQQALTIT